MDAKAASLRQKRQRFQRGRGFGKGQAAPHDIAIDLSSESGLDSGHLQAPIAWQGSGSLAQLDTPAHTPLTEPIHRKALRGRWSILSHHSLETLKEKPMKRTVIAVGLIALLFALAAQAQAPAPKPGPEHKKLEIWVGDWTAEGENKATPLGPAGKLTGKVSARKILGGFFMEFRIELSGPSGTSQNYEIDGYDSLKKRYTWNNFGSDGSASVATYTIDANTVTYSGTITLGEKQYKTRGTIVFAADLNSMVEKDELSVDGKTWMPWGEFKFIKAKSSPK